MKKITAVLLAMVLALCSFSLVLADDPDEIPGTVEMPRAGLTFVPPEAYRNTVGRIVTDGNFEIYSGTQYAYWFYCAMTEEELAAAYTNPDSLVATLLFYVFSIGNGNTFDDMNAAINNELDPQYAREIGKVGEYTFYLYMEDANQIFADSIDEKYKAEYLELAAMKDEAAAAFTCYEPFASLIGSKVKFTTTDLDGNAVSSADLFAQNEITMVNIWATWCGPCVGELAELQQIHTRLQEKNCGIVGLLDDTDLDAARQLVADNGVEYPVILAPNNFYSLFPIEAYPTSFFIDREGRIIAAPIQGAYVDQYESRMEFLLGAR